MHDDASVSQRNLARELGIALGLTNAYLKRCINKGYIKVRKVPPNRYAYYLTPKGFSEKSRLTAQYFKRSFNLYRHARRDLEQCFQSVFEQHGACRIALCGAGELAEIAILVATQYDVTIAAIIDGSARQKQFLSLPVVQSIEGVEEVDAVMVTDFQRPQRIYDTLKAHVEDARILTPDVLKITRGNATGADT